MSPKLVSDRSAPAVIDAKIDKDTEGVLLLSVGGITSGFTAYMDKGFLKARYYAMRLNRYKTASETFDIGVDLDSSVAPD